MPAVPREDEEQDLVLFSETVVGGSRVQIAAMCDYEDATRSAR